MSWLMLFANEESLYGLTCLAQEKTRRTWNASKRVCGENLWGENVVRTDSARSQENIVTDVSNVLANSCWHGGSMRYSACPWMGSTENLRLFAIKWKTTGLHRTTEQQIESRNETRICHFK